MLRPRCRSGRRFRFAHRYPVDVLHLRGEVQGEENSLNALDREPLAEHLARRIEDAAERAVLVGLAGDTGGARVSRLVGGEKVLWCWRGGNVWGRGDEDVEQAKAGPLCVMRRAFETLKYCSFVWLYFRDDMTSWIARKRCFSGSCKEVNIQTN